MTISKLAQGIEPWTSTLPRWRSTAELCQQHQPAGHASPADTRAAATNRRGGKANTPLGLSSPPLLALAKAVGAAEALKGEKYKRALINVKWG